MYPQEWGEYGTRTQAATQIRRDEERESNLFEHSPRELLNYWLITYEARTNNVPPLQNAIIDVILFHSVDGWIHFPRFVPSPGCESIAIIVIIIIEGKYCSHFCLCVMTRSKQE